MTCFLYKLRVFYLRDILQHYKLNETKKQYQQTIDSMLNIDVWLTQ